MEAVRLSPFYAFKSTLRSEVFRLAIANLDKNVLNFDGLTYHLFDDFRPLAGDLLKKL